MPTWIEKLFGYGDLAAGPGSGEKSLSVSLQPGGFVTELRGVGGLSAPRADTASLQAVQLQNELVFACIDTKATAALDPRLIVERRVGRGGKMTYEEVPDHPFRQLIMRPNPEMTESDLMKAAIVSWDVSNPRRFYCEKEYTRGLLTALYPLDPGCMTPKVSRDRRDLIGYVWSDGVSRREYGLDELLIRRAPAWYDPPPLVSALGATESDSAQTAYIRGFFANGGIPPGILKYNMPLNQAQRDEIRDKWRATHGARFGRSHDIGVLDVNVEYQQTGAQLDQLASQTLRSVAESRICMVFKVPPLIVYAYVGLIRATYSNLKEAWAGFWDATMSPAFREWRVFWLWSLLSEFEEEGAIRAEDVRLQYDMSQVAALQDDVDGIQGRARANFQAGGISLNEYRNAIGASAVDGGDDLYVAKPMTTLRGMVNPALPEAAPEKTGQHRKDRAAPGVQVIERRMERDLAQYLAAEYRTAARAVEGA